MNEWAHLTLGYKRIYEENVIINNGCWGRLKDRKRLKRLTVFDFVTILLV